MEEPAPLLTVKQVATQLNIKPQTIYHGTAPESKKPFPIPHIRIGNAIRFQPKDIQAFLDSQCKNQS